MTVVEEALQDNTIPTKPEATAPVPRNHLPGGRKSTETSWTTTQRLLLAFCVFNSVVFVVYNADYNYNTHGLAQEGLTFQELETKRRSGKGLLRYGRHVSQVHKEDTASSEVTDQGDKGKSPIENRPESDLILRVAQAPGALDNVPSPMPFDEDAPPYYGPGEEAGYSALMDAWHGHPNGEEPPGNDLSVPGNHFEQAKQCYREIARYKPDWQPTFKKAAHAARTDGVYIFVISYPGSERVKYQQNYWAKLGYDIEILYGWPKDDFTPGKSTPIYDKCLIGTFRNLARAYAANLLSQYWAYMKALQFGMRHAIYLEDDGLPNAYVNWPGANDTYGDPSVMAGLLAKSIGEVPMYNVDQVALGTCIQNREDVFGKIGERGAPLPGSEQLIEWSRGGRCATAYMMSVRAMRRMIRRIPSIAPIDITFDFALSDMAKGRMDWEPPPRNLAIEPALFIDGSHVSPEDYDGKVPLSKAFESNAREGQV